MPSGELTAQVARTLSQELEPRGFDVLFDHGDKSLDQPDKLGQIVSWFGPDYKAAARLAFLDIAIVQQNSDKALVLVEIEETTAKPKVLLGDVLATLLGGQITFQGKRHLQIGPWTTLIVLACGQAQRRQARVAFLQDQSNQIRRCLDTPNASIGRVVVDTFKDQPDLQAKLKQHVEKALTD